MIRTDRVVERMEALGLTAHSAAKQAGLGPDFVRDIIRGRTKDPSSWRLRLLAEVLQCSAEYLLGLTDELGAAPQVVANYGERVVRLRVRYELKFGYFHEPGTRVWSDEDGAITSFYDEAHSVVSMTEADEDEWLELVVDPQLRFIKGSLLHVTPFDTAEQDCVVIVNHYIGELVQRSVHQLTFDAHGAYLWPNVEGVDSDQIKRALAGEEFDHFGLVGFVHRSYLLTDNTGPFPFI